MSDPLVDKIARAVLYEGFILYPYRASSKKNRTRFTFGRVYPEAYSAAQDGAEPFVMQTQCLVKREAGGAALEVTVRFLQAMAREIDAFPAPLPGSPGQLLPGSFERVRELRVDDKIYQAWQEAVEREIAIPPQPLEALADAPRKVPFSFSASRTTEPIRDSRNQAVGAILRRQEAMEGEIEIAAQAIDTEVSRVTVRISNHTPAPENGWEDQNELILRTFASAHTILHAREGEFLSLLDPPAAYAGAAAACKNIGTWPVLAGEMGKRATMLSSPIILYDYPEIAPESPGELCDGTEIDEILTLRIMTMTDDEKSEMRQVDDFARKILQRTESLGGGDLLQMHGVMRETNAFDEQFFNPNTRVESVAVKGFRLKTGDRVRIHPKGRADAIDMALNGRIAIIEALEQDAEERIHLALVIEDDPGRDLGMLRQPGHRFFYGIEEVEPLREGE